MKNTILAAFFTGPLFAVAAFGQPTAAVTLNNFFDNGVPVKIKVFTADNATPEIKKSGAVPAPRTPAQQDLDAFLVKMKTRILAVRGVKNVYVGLDCPVTEPHVHIVPHKPAAVIRLDGSVPGKEVKENLLKAVPELGKKPFRLEPPLMEQLADYKVTRIQLLAFQKHFIDRILTTRGVLGVYVGRDMRPANAGGAALIITLAGKIEPTMVRSELTRIIPDLSEIPFRLEPAAAEPRPGEIRCWNAEGCW